MGGEIGGAARRSGYVGGEGGEERGALSYVGGAGGVEGLGDADEGFGGLEEGVGVLFLALATVLVSWGGGVLGGPARRAGRI